MEVMRIGLWVASAVAVLGAWSSWQAGFPPELAVVRGTIAFVAVSFVAYIAALVVATAPPVASGDAQQRTGQRGPAGRTSADVAAPASPTAVAVSNEASLAAGPARPVPTDETDETPQLRAA